MSNGLQAFDIILFAMIAAFFAFRLWSVLGRKTGHEPRRRPTPGRDIPHRDEEADTNEAAALADEADRRRAELRALPLAVRRGVEEIYQADRAFDLATFLDGARIAYRMILEAFWQGQDEEFRPFVSDEVFAQFADAIDDRQQHGLSLENRLLEISDMTIESAKLSDSIAEIVLRFDSEIVAVTRNAEGEVIEGDVTDTIRIHDIWTFERDVTSADPNWLLVETRAD